MAARAPLKAALGFLPAAALVGLALFGIHFAQLGLPPAANVTGVERLLHWSAANPPPVNQPGRPVSLPDRRSGPPAAPLRYRWYRITLPAAPDPLRSQGLMIWTQRANVAGYVDGWRVDGSVADSRHIREDGAPILLLPPAAPAGARQTLLLRVRPTPSGYSTLGTIHCGALSHVFYHYAWRYRVVLGERYLLAMLLVALSIPALSLWLRSRDEREYLWLSVALLAFALYTLQSLAPLTTAPAIFWDWAECNGFALFMVCLHVFVNRLLRRPQPRRERILALAAFLAMPLLWAVARESPALYFHVASPLWDTATFALASFTTWQMLDAYLRRPGAEEFSGLLAGLLMLSTRAHDVLGNHHIAPFSGGRYLFMVMPAVLFIYVHIILLRLQRARAVAEQLSREVSSRVLARQQELEQAFDQLRAVEAERLLLGERQRIMRDMHDGVGGALVSALARLELDGGGLSGTAGTLRSALTDLRLMIASLRPGETALGPVLADLRQRLGAQAADAGLKLSWDMTQLQRQRLRERADTLQVMRIIQEAFTNTIKHARAAQFSVVMTPQAHDGVWGVELVLQDDGTGFNPDRVKGDGQGIHNMRARSAQIDGHLEIFSDAAGTRISLWLPTTADAPSDQ